MKPTYRKSWAGNLVMFSGPSFEVKRWLTGFGEFSFWWIQICIGSPMCRSSCICDRRFLPAEAVFLGVFFNFFFCFHNFYVYSVPKVTEIFVP